MQVIKRARIRNRYNQVPHLTQVTNGKVTSLQLDITNESKEVSAFPAGDHKATIKKRAQKHNKHTADPQNGTVSKNILCFGILDKNSVKTPMMNFIIFIAKYCIFSSKYKMQRPTFESFLKTLHQRKEAEHYIALAKDKIEQHNQKLGFLRNF